MKESKTINGLMDDPRLHARVKIENYLLVHLKLRPCSQTTFPTELPDGDALGAAIDERIYPLMSSIGAVADPRKRLTVIDGVKKEMRAAFKEIVEASDRYRAHLKWTEALGLRSLRVEVRPTIQELYLFKDKEVAKRLKRLMKEREKLRRQALRRPSPNLGRVQLAYPGEFKSRWLREMGGLLGYPSCCVDRYASEREHGVSVEKREAQQIREAEQRGAVDPFTYFVGYFFPCSPYCDKALSRGREYHERLRGLDPSLGKVYMSIVSENLDHIRRQPEIIAEYKTKLIEASPRRGAR